MGYISEGVMKKFLMVLLILIIAVCPIGCEKDCEGIEEERRETAETVEQIETAEETVYIAPYGKKYHLRPTCAGKNAMPISKQHLAKTYEPCQKCVK